MPVQAHDRLFRSLLSDGTALLALLRLTLPGPALDGVEPAHLRVLDPALTRGRRARYPDRLVELRHPSGDRLLILIEHQARAQRDMALRLLEEAVLLTRRELGASRRARAGVPKVLALVVAQGARPWREPAALSEAHAFRAPALERLRPWLPELRYALLDLCVLDPGRLPDHPRLRLGLRLLGCAHERNPWPLLLEEAASLRALVEGDDREGLRQVVSYAAEIASTPPPPGFSRDLARAAGYPLPEVFMSWASQLRRQGRQEGRQEGIVEGERRGEIVGQRRLLQRLLERRFGPLEPELAARIEAADLDQIARWTDRLLTEETAAAVLGG